MASTPERIVLTYQDLIELPNDRNRYEIIDGELQVTAAPNTAHQTAVGNLAVILIPHVRRRRLGRVFVAPYDVLFSETSVVEPDLVFVAREHQDIIQRQHIRGVPDLVVEVLSPSTAATDRHTKQQVYARFGVPNYWMLDPDRREAIALVLDNCGYREAVRAGGDETFAAPPFADLLIELPAVWGDDVSES